MEQNELTFDQCLEFAQVYLNQLYEIAGSLNIKNCYKNYVISIQAEQLFLDIASKTTSRQVIKKALNSFHLCTGLVKKANSIRKVNNNIKEDNN